MLMELQEVSALYTLHLSKRYQQPQTERLSTSAQAPSTAPKYSSGLYRKSQWQDIFSEHLWHKC